MITFLNPSETRSAEVRSWPKAPPPSVNAEGSLLQGDRNGERGAALSLKFAHLWRTRSAMGRGAKRPADARRARRCQRSMRQNASTPAGQDGAGRKPAIPPRGQNREA